MHNQTDERSLTLARNHRGTGVFLIPDVYSKADRPVKVVKVPDITYTDCAKRGELTLAFKWIPTADGGGGTPPQTPYPCDNTLCVGSCANPDCICDLGKCVGAAETPHNPTARVST